ATSTDTEHAFSGSGLTISQMQHSLSDQSTCATSVLASWASIKGMVPEAEIIQTFQNKKNRDKNGNKGVKSNEIIEID
ncbi:hypothetical protein K439DRAFT_1362512, partial [Ramaria rubella]